MQPGNSYQIAVKTRDRPLLVGEFDIDIQTYLKALRKAGTPVSFLAVLADAEGRCHNCKK